MAACHSAFSSLGLIKGGLSPCKSSPEFKRRHLQKALPCNLRLALRKLCLPGGGEGVGGCRLLCCSADLAEEQMLPRGRREFPPPPGCWGATQFAEVSGRSTESRSDRPTAAESYCPLPCMPGLGSAPRLTTAPSLLPL